MISYATDLQDAQDLTGPKGPQLLIRWGCVPLSGAWSARPGKRWSAANDLVG